MHLLSSPRQGWTNTVFRHAQTTRDLMVLEIAEVIELDHHRPSFIQLLEQATNQVRILEVPSEVILPKLGACQSRRPAT